MSSTGNVNEHGMDDNQPEQQQIGEQAMDFQQLSSLLSDIEMSEATSNQQSRGE